MKLRNQLRIFFTKSIYDTLLSKAKVHKTVLASFLCIPYLDKFSPQYQITNITVKNGLGIFKHDVVSRNEKMQRMN